MLVICGNPPYSGISQNRSAEQYVRAHKRIKDRQVNGCPSYLDWWFDRNIQSKWTANRWAKGTRNGLQDDYVKFIRFAQWKMEPVDRGIVAIITNHSFLDNPTFRGMRKSLLDTFDALYFLDLHGNAKKKETVPEWWQGRECL